MNVCGARHHRGDGDDGDGEADRRQSEPRRGGSQRPARPTHQRHDRGADRQRAEGGADRVGELQRLGLFEAVDPRDARHPGHDPGDDGRAVDHCGCDSHGAATAHERHQPDDDLRGGDGDKQPRQGRMLGVDPDGCGVDGAGPQRGQALQRCDPTRGGGPVGRPEIAVLRHRLAA